MAGIAGILKGKQHFLITEMLKVISHRGTSGMSVTDYPGATIGMVYSRHEEAALKENLKNKVFCDGPGFGQKAEVSKLNGHWIISRDELGVSPMYYAYSDDGTLCFASEVKALAKISSTISELPSGSVLTEHGQERHFSIKPQQFLKDSPEVIAAELLNLITLGVSRRITTGTMGAWLSGGLDSSAIASIARPWLSEFHTFAGGVSGSPDLEFAREAARHIGSRHHELVIEFDQMLWALPRVIYHLESFDPLLVRSSIVNFLVAQRAADYVGEVFSGEGADELFAGYAYLKSIPGAELGNELIDITNRLHNTALQRVDRCAAAHSLTPHVVFADPMLFDFAFRIPPEFKLKDGIEKWILRQAVADLLPTRIVWRPKAKFWQGAGVESMLFDYASRKITDADFSAEKVLPNNWILNSKEELLYYRIFREYFGDLANLEWMGRTKTTTAFN